jgi:DNA mismatch repair protein MSH6
MIFTSKRSGFSRYVTEQTRKLVSDVEYVEQQIKEQMGLFVGYFFEEFRKNQKIWEKYISVVGEIDCLVALSIISQQMGGVRPEFVEKGFDIKQAKHPCLNAGDVIANDINLESKIMLLTGPNMGGKSTLLRTACLTVILAQMGCFVPAERY